jgi:hypothetical protein
MESKEAFAQHWLVSSYTSEYLEIGEFPTLQHLCKGMVMHSVWRDRDSIVDLKCLLPPHIYAYLRMQFNDGLHTSGG